MRAARSRRSARNSMSNNSGTARLCAAASGRRQAGDGGCVFRGRARDGARFCASAALRRLRNDRRRRPQLLRRLLERGGIPRRMRLHRPAGFRSRRPSRRPAALASPRAAHRTDARCRGLWRSGARPRDPAEIWPQGRDRADDGPLHGAAGRRRGRSAARAGSAASHAACGAAASISRRWSRASCRGGLESPTDPFAASPHPTDSAAQGHEPAPAPQDRRRRISGARQAAVAGKTIILVDDVLTTGSTAEACARTLQASRCGARRVDQLGARGETFAVDALTLLPKYLRVKDSRDRRDLYQDILPLLLARKAAARVQGRRVSRRFPSIMAAKRASSMVERARAGRRFRRFSSASTTSAGATICWLSIRRASSTR